ncbi:MAG: response regulator [Sphingomicrobium sp.]
MHQAIDSFWSSQYAPHGYCLLWRADLILTHLVSDVLIALAYFSIPFALIRFVRKRKDIEFGALFWLFAIFILACGLTHVIAAWNLWHGNYGLEGVIKAITAAASVPTAIILWRILPQALVIPSPSDLQAANSRLSAMVMERDLAVGRLELEIRERLKAEEALVQVKKIDAIGQLTGGIAHDFNNLLQAISGNLELIARNLDKRESIARWTANAAKAVERGAKLARQLLVFARVGQLEKQQVHVNHVIADMTDLIEQSVGKQVRLRLDLDDDACTVLTEANQLELAILNLCINARDAMPKGGEIRISTSIVRGTESPAALGPEPHVRISISDDGTGMSPEVASKALDPFFTTKEVGKGTGLGLSMAFGFARQSGGVLQLESTQGEGTIVHIFLPCSATGSKKAEYRHGSGPPSLLKTNDRQGLIVLVDDDDDVRIIMADMLEYQGYTVRSFASPSDALADPDLEKASVVILDFMMPEMNGADLAAALRKRIPEQRIVFVSGYSDSAALDSLSGPNSRVLRKPFSSEDLAAVLAELSVTSS